MCKKNSTFARTLLSVTAEELIHSRLTDGRNICVCTTKGPLFFILLSKFLSAIDIRLSCHFVNLFTM